MRSEMQEWDEQVDLKSYKTGEFGYIEDSKATDEQREPRPVRNRDISVMHMHTGASKGNSHATSEIDEKGFLKWLKQTPKDYQRGRSTRAGTKIGNLLAHQKKEKGW